MIRSAFLRRMAHVAMAGMLGAELAWRAPKISTLTVGQTYTWIKGVGMVEGTSPGTYMATIPADQMIGKRLAVVGVDHEANTMTMAIL